EDVSSKEGAEQAVEIELRDEEPSFLKGQTHLSLELSPVRIVKNPEGSLNRAAMSGGMLAAERREMRQQIKAEEEALKGTTQPDLSISWADPLSQKHVFAQDIKNNAPESVPEWKRAAF